jgi:hypothetical protein
VSLLFLAFTVPGVLAQSADDDAPRGFGRRRPEPVPKNVLESREKMRIEKEKKDYAEMLERGDDALKLAERVTHSFGVTGKLSDEDLAMIESIEKNVKKIRSDLGGDDEDEKLDDILGADRQPSLADAVSTLGSATTELIDELKKTTRFSISAAAIHSSNAVLAIARFLRFGK